MFIRNESNKLVAGLQSSLLSLGLLFGGWSQAAQMCDESLETTTPDEEFNINTDGTVSHLKTELVWDRCSWGLSGENCEQGTASEHNWEDAQQQAEIANNQAYKGYTDWRVPTRQELLSIVEFQCYQPAINERVFPTTPSAAFWSSSPSASSADGAWGVNFNTRNDAHGYRSSNIYVRLVRGGLFFVPSTESSQSCNDGATILNNVEFSIHDNGTVTHQQTKLIWDQCIWGQSGINCDNGDVNGYLWSEALQQAKVANQQNYKGYNDWRLPTISELLSITEVTCAYPAINTSVFPSTPSSAFWSTSPLAADSDETWYVHFAGGGYNGYSTSNSYLGVRLVRGEQPFVSLPTNQTPTAAFSLSPTSGQAPLTITLDGSASSDPEADNLTYAWTINGAAVGNGAMQFDYTFNTAGDYLIALTVTDSEGLSHTSSQSLTVGEDNSTPETNPEESDNNTSEGNTEKAVSLTFKTEKAFYHVGESLKVELIESVNANRFQRIDLWVAVQIPTGDIFFMTPYPIQPFDLVPQAFKTAVDSANVTHQIIAFDVPEGMGGTYTFYAVAVETGKSPMSDNLLFITRSNLAQLDINLAGR
ncbi:Lcl domain-containing protein [Candidatus Venteria ishoeyi]|uniref:PKD domain protein n=1 Tax=Candidatus Venteria ishoeyi TaxID=1899563 RepID=A0A1H6FFU8_9GAMM|nr:DUF1566 domain-containing protein [Candidatus Venteria ishoeyi]SEH08907.1 PKD domain protein [Candidatus Venteria ishoeyi]